MNTLAGEPTRRSTAPSVTPIYADRQLGGHALYSSNSAGATATDVNWQRTGYSAVSSTPSLPLENDSCVIASGAGPQRRVHGTCTSLTPA